MTYEAMWRPWSQKTCDILGYAECPESAKSLAESQNGAALKWEVSCKDELWCSDLQNGRYSVWRRSRDLLG